MGFYYNPPSNLPNVGRALENPPAGSTNNEKYAYLYKQLQPNEHLYGLYVRLDAPWSNAPHLCEAGEVEAFDSQVRQGRIIFKGFFALPIEISGSTYPVVPPEAIEVGEANER